MNDIGRSPKDRFLDVINELGISLTEEVHEKIKELPALEFGKFIREFTENLLGWKEEIEAGKSVQVSQQASKWIEAEL